MARTALTVQTVITSGTGLAPSYATVDNANGNYFTWPGGRVFLHVKNTNAATRTLTIDAPQTIDGLAMADPTYTIAATTGDHLIGPLSDKLVQTNGQVYLDWSAATNTTVAVIAIA